MYKEISFPQLALRPVQILTCNFLLHFFFLNLGSPGKRDGGSTTASPDTVSKRQRLAAELPSAVPSSQRSPVIKFIPYTVPCKSKRTRVISTTISMQALLGVPAYAFMCNCYQDYFYYDFSIE